MRPSSIRRPPCFSPVRSAGCAPIPTLLLCCTVCTTLGNSECICGTRLSASNKDQGGNGFSEVNLIPSTAGPSVSRAPIIMPMPMPCSCVWVQHCYTGLMVLDGLTHQLSALLRTSPWWLPPSECPSDLTRLKSNKACHIGENALPYISPALVLKRQHHPRPLILLT
ncbi:hypothetical protein BX600DRAFT_141806 [Xylariales sp. PMI_506]|nr:hypothetical protein BX600DRAFT_141806 [Xylariales sp. PMI_506]